MTSVFFKKIKELFQHAAYFQSLMSRYQYLIEILTSSWTLRQLDLLLFKDYIGECFLLKESSNDD